MYKYSADQKVAVKPFVEKRIAEIIEKDPTKSRDDLYYEVEAELLYDMFSPAKSYDDYIDHVIEMKEKVSEWKQNTGITEETWQRGNKKIEFGGKVIDLVEITDFKFLEELSKRYGVDPKEMRKNYHGSRKIPSRLYLHSQFDEETQNIDYQVVIEGDDFGYNRYPVDGFEKQEKKSSEISKYFKDNNNDKKSFYKDWLVEEFADSYTGRKYALSRDEYGHLNITQFDKDNVRRIMTDEPILSPDPKNKEEIQNMYKPKKTDNVIVQKLKSFLSLITKKDKTLMLKDADEIKQKDSKGTLVDELKSNVTSELSTEERVIKIKYDDEHSRE